MTTSMSATERPCAASPRMKVSSRFMCQFGRVGRSLSLPMQLSTSTVWSGVRRM